MTFSCVSLETSGVVRHVQSDLYASCAFTGKRALAASLGNHDCGFRYIGVGAKYLPCVTNKLFQLRPYIWLKKVFANVHDGGSN